MKSLHMAVVGMVFAGMLATIIVQGIRLQDRARLAGAACPLCMSPGEAQHCPPPPAPPECPPPPPSSCPPGAPAAPSNEGEDEDGSKGGAGPVTAGRGAVDDSKGSWKEVRWWRGPGDWKQYSDEELWGGQDGIEKILVDMFDGKRKGYFVDLGASFGTSLSNTATLEQKYGWRGLCVEAAYEDKRFQPQLIERRCDVAFALVGAKTGEKLRYRIRSVLSGITRGREFHNKEGDWWAEGQQHFPHKNKTSIALTKLLDDFSVPSVVDVMQVSVTGGELWILENFDFNRYKFLVGLIANPPKQLTKLLKEHGYEHMASYGEDHVYLHTSFERFDYAMGKYANASTA